MCTEIVNFSACENFINSIESNCTRRVFGDGQKVLRALKGTLQDLYLEDASPRTLKGSRVIVRSAPEEDVWIEYSRSCRYPNRRQCTYAEFVYEGEGWKIVNMWRSETSDTARHKLSTLASKVEQTGRRKDLEAEWRQENAELAKPVRKGLKAMAKTWAETKDVDKVRLSFLSAYGIKPTVSLAADIEFRDAVPPHWYVYLKDGTFMVRIGQYLRRALKRRGVALECGSTRLFFR